MRVAGWLGFLLVCVELAGCSSLGKKTALPKSGDDHAPAANPHDDRPAPSALVSPASSDGTALIFGRVGDTFSKTRYSDIWVVPPADGQGAPVARHTETDQQGYFTVKNLQPGLVYRVIAQTKDGNYKEAGEVTVRPPSHPVYILVSADRHPAIPGGADPGPAPSIGPPLPVPSAGGPGRDSGPSIEMGPPAPLTPASGSAGGEIPIQPENFADGARTRISPDVRIPGPGAPRPPVPPRPAPNPNLPLSGPPLAPIGVTPVPSCDRRGNTVYNFALAGLDGQPWEYRRDRLPASRLVLIDFWGTWCAPCRATITGQINRLNELYGRQGLEIVGIAYERKPTFDAQVRTVETAIRKLDIRYRVLMGAGVGTCPVQRDFDVKAFPTLVLINDKGQIIWRKEGPTSPEFDQLRVVIRRELGIR